MPTRPPTLKSRRPIGVQSKPNRQAKRLLHTGSKAWRAIRQDVLIRDLYTCQHCNRWGDQVDHRDNDSHNNDPANLQTLCLSCHSAKTAREQAGKPEPIRFNAMGEPI